MPIYEFVDPTNGSDVEVFLPMDEAPDFGETIVHEGRTLVRVVRFSSNVYVDNGGQSVQAPKWDPLAPQHDRKGRPQFRNKREAREYSRKFNARQGGNPNFHSLDVE